MGSQEALATSALLGTPPPAAVLVDFDNTNQICLDSGFRCSFKSLRNYVRRFGRVPLAFVFVSPYSASRQNIRRLYEDGWSVVACPLSSKDKDSVDAQIERMAKSLAQDSTVETIVIVSEDADLANNAHLSNAIRDLGKKLEVVRVSELKSELQSDDSEELRPLEISAEQNKFKTLLERFRGGEFFEDDPAMRIYADLIRSVARVILKYNEEERLGFDKLKNFVWVHPDENIFMKFRNKFTIKHLNILLTQMNHMGILRPQFAVAGSRRYYTINQEDKDWLSKL